MIRNFINQELPPGLVDANLEIYADGTKLMAVYNGSNMIFEKLPEEILQEFFILLHKDTLALECLKKSFSSKAEMLYQYVWCNFGGWNRSPDYDGKLHTEYWDCGFRGRCEFECKICKAVNPDTKNLTERELQISKMIAIGLLDKEIADILNISINTATTHRQRIENKLNAPRRVDVASFIYKNNLLVSPNAPVA
jgi:DNA-binding CsgD family transcriptional regulator